MYARTAMAKNPDSPDVTQAAHDTEAAPDTPRRFATARGWQSWLAKHHAKSDGLWLLIAKAGAPQRTLSYAEAVEVALCYGWIDGQSRGGDPYWRQRFTPRRARSLWSRINCERAQALIEAGRMAPAGLAEVQRAQADGRWQAAYDSPSRATVPPDLAAALAAEPRAAAFFAQLDGTNRYAVLWRVQTAKRAATRARRIEQLVGMLARGETVHPVKPKKT